MAYHRRQNHAVQARNLFGGTPKEAEVLGVIQEFLRYRGVFFWRNNSGAYQEGNRFIKFGLKGSSDLLAVYPGERKTGVGRGLMWAIEVKRPQGILSEAQISFLRGVRGAGGISTVAEGVDDVDRVLGDRTARSGERYERHLGNNPQ